MDINFRQFPATVMSALEEIGQSTDWPRKVCCETGAGVRTETGVVGRQMPKARQRKLPVNLSGSAIKRNAALLGLFLMTLRLSKELSNDE
jgi:hypothetical protein